MKFKAFLKRKDIEISLRRYGIDALAAMAKGLFCTLLVGTILDTLGTQLHIGFLNAVICTIGSGEDTKISYTEDGNVLKTAWEAKEAITVITLSYNTIVTVDNFTYEGEGGKAAPAVPSAFISSPSSPVNSEKPFPEKQKSIFWLLPS